MGERVLKAQVRQSPQIPSSTPQGNPLNGELDFVPRTAWEHRLQELLEFRRINGHVNVPRTWSLNLKLANWVSNQRRLVRLGLLGKERLARLESFGISWAGEEARREAQQETWDRMFGALRTFSRQFGHLDVPKGWTAEPALGAWLTNQRYLWRKGILPEGRARRLQELDGAWHRTGARAEPRPERVKPAGRRATEWERRFAALTEYHRRHGHCGVPARCPEDRELAQWVVHQRVQRRRGRLSAERFDRLDALGFVWSGAKLLRTRQDLLWEERFKALSRFVATEGHCCVPLQDDATLGAWVFRQRHDRRRGKLSADRIRRLDSIRFEWTLPKIGGAGRARLWEARFNELEDFVREHGGLESLEGALLEWVTGQRRRQRRGLLAPELARRLESAGAVWSIRDQQWESKYAELLDYRKRHGDCAVAMGGESDRSLARWVSAQRTAKKTGRLSASRIQRLNAAGFLWAATPVFKVSN